MRKTLTAAALALILSCTAWAGVIHTPGSPQPEPTPAPASTAQEPTTADEDATGVTETLTQIALDLASSVLSLL